MKEDQRPRKKYNHIQKALLIEWLKNLLPVPAVGNKRQGWRRLPVGEWAKKLDVSRKTLYLWLRALEVAGYIQAETFYKGSPKRLTKAKATMSLIENSSEDIAKIRLKNFSYISEHKEKKLAAYKYIASELAHGESVMMDTAGALDALYAIPQWVVWKYGSLDRETRKPKKVLLSAKPSANNAYARCDDLLTWTNYAQAQDRLEASHMWKVPLQGVAFALNKNGIVMLDLDHCIHDGMIDAWAQDIIDTINSYTEVSPSSTGVHIIVYGNIPANVNHNGIEMYDQGKFMSVTGKHLSGTPPTIEHRQEQLDALYAEVAPKEMSTFVCGTCQLLDEEVLAKARSARSGPKFIRLFDKGDCSGHPSHSHADFDLCNMLAYWTSNDVSMIDRLFRRSALYREKWDRKARTGETYGEGTIKRALLSE